MKQQIAVDFLPQPSGAYSQAISVCGTKRLYMSSLSAIEAGDTIENQTKNLLEGISKLLQKSEFTINDIVKVTVYLKNEDDRQKFNQIYSNIMPKPYSCRSILIVQDLDSLLEMEIIAEK